MKRFFPVTVALAGFLVLAAYASPVGAGVRPSHVKDLRGRAGGSSGYGESLCVSHSSLCIDAYDNPGDEYVGHDEPSVEFKSGVSGSGPCFSNGQTFPGWFMRSRATAAFA